MLGGALAAVESAANSQVRADRQPGREEHGEQKEQVRDGVAGEGKRAVAVAAAATATTGVWPLVTVSVLIVVVAIIIVIVDVVADRKVRIVVADGRLSLGVRERRRRHAGKKRCEQCRRRGEEDHTKDVGSNEAQVATFFGSTAGPIDQPAIAEL